MLGNLWELCEDDYRDGYEGAPADGSAWMSGPDPERGVVRGASLWEADEEFSYSRRAWMFRRKNPHFTTGFRLVREDKR